MTGPQAGGLVFEDDFDGDTADALDRSRWLPHYLPQWSSRAASAATWQVRDSCLHLSVPPHQGLWCPEVQDDPPLRVSGVQSGVFSGPVGSRVGQQPVDERSVVREVQEPWWGWTPHLGRLELRGRMSLSPRSMAAWWFVGLEDSPERCGELCVMEVFGRSVAGASAEVGMGVHAFRDPALREDWEAPRLDLDVSDFHVYAVDWRPGSADFLVDGEVVRTTTVSPDYPVQSMLAVFDFPTWATSGDEQEAVHVPELVVDWVRGYAP
ncbi:glycoside hydrolase family 16 [Phycicoccus sp. Root563]|uniref:glycoside hydrolase family 16 protein n=1 Tax=Phycicoccus sp. Root563 TaxID=1736562 RepID=UPI0007039E51|nr:glycoside hydrolase family 16 protein [Phycicoccus sp. Root563]KQZ88974.1 glycoside hydrolase family 16 [Phycicoccus sp. Root563]